MRGEWGLRASTWAEWGASGMDKAEPWPQCLLLALGTPVLGSGRGPKASGMGVGSWDEGLVLPWIQP